MQSRPISYVFGVSYFGAGYKGWAPQPQQQTVQRKIERVIRHVLGHEDFSVLGASRTDSGVSCRKGFFQIFLKSELDLAHFLAELNLNLPSDIQIFEPRSVHPDFNLIQEVDQKTYRYYFTDSSELQPLYASFIHKVRSSLDFSAMKEAAHCFEGVHDFYAFCRPAENKKNYEREVLTVRIHETDSIEEMHFPFRMYYFEVTGKGFLHHQVRKMMTAIWEVGAGNWQISDIQARLNEPRKDWEQIPPAPSNGLILWETKLKF